MMSKFYNNAKTAVLLGLMTALILWIGTFFHNGIYVATVFAAISNIVAYFFSDKIAIMATRSKEVGAEHELYQIVQELAQRANLPMPRVYVSDNPAPNAFATGRNPRHAAVCATAGLLEMLDRDEVAGVMAHELAHVKHRDILISSVAATIAGAISMLGYMFMFGGGARDREGNGHPLAGLLVLLLGPLAAGLIQAAISRSREFNADKQGAEIVGDPMHLATALEKIHLASRQIPMDVNPAFNSMFIIEPLNAVESIGKLFQTHPPLEKRLMNLIGRESTGRVGVRYAA
ncbi:MAG TPA: M48 family metalloprotease [Tepidisphaeraceae bacterium]|jgi:heat shock protein HtpX|nr:M48 family metalloprotease [Tepidisphaeraceae bacterium]